MLSSQIRVNLFISSLCHYCVRVNVVDWFWEDFFFSNCFCLAALVNWYATLPNSINIDSNYYCNRCFHFKQRRVNHSYRTEHSDRLRDVCEVNAFKFISIWPETIQTVRQSQVHHNTWLFQASLCLYWRIPHDFVARISVKFIWFAFLFSNIFNTLLDS